MVKIQEEIIEEFSVFDDWLDKYDYLIGLSDSLPAIPAEHRTVQYLIEGCQSRVWVDARMEQGRVYYAADSDAIITKGIIALLIRVLNGRTPQEILGALFHRRHRPERKPLAHAVERLVVDGQADAALCAGLREQGRCERKIKNRKPTFLSAEEASGPANRPEPESRKGEFPAVFSFQRLISMSR